MGLDTFTYEYLPFRNISSSSFSFYDARTKILPDGKPVSIGFRYPCGAYKVRSIDKKEFYWSGPSRPGLFGADKFEAGCHKWVTITEGELDALSIWEVCKAPAVSVQSAATADRDCAAHLEWLRSFERVVLFFDNDGPGQEATRRVAQLFDYDKVYVVRSVQRKDANEFLQLGDRDLLLACWSSNRKYVPTTLVMGLDEFERILLEPVKEGHPYPWKCLTDLTYGIRTGESVLLTAREKVGKTELMHFIEHKLLKETGHGVGAFFLEEPKSRHLRALAGIELGRPIHLPGHSVPDAEVLRALRAVVSSDERLFIFDHFGSSDADALIENIRFLVRVCGCKYILLDHISMVVAARGAKEDERRALDYLSTKLEVLVKELDFSLIMVSHVNDEGQTRGSRWLTKVADITINANRDLMAFDPTKRATIDLSIPYNRFCGLTGPAGSIVFDQATYSFREVTQEEKELEAASEAAKLLKHIVDTHREWRDERQKILV